LTKVVRRGNARDFGHLKPLEHPPLEACVLDEAVDWAIQVAPNASDSLQPVPAILPPGHSLVATAAVLQEQERAAGFQHAADFAQCGFHLAHVVPL